MKNKNYIAIICAFSIVFAVSSGFLIKHYYDSAKQAEMYDNLIEVVETEPEETKEPMNYSEEKPLSQSIRSFICKTTIWLAGLRLRTQNQLSRYAVKGQSELLSEARL